VGTRHSNARARPSFSDAGRGHEVRASAHRLRDDNDPPVRRHHPAVPRGPAQGASRTVRHALAALLAIKDPSHRTEVGVDLVGRPDLALLSGTLPVGHVELKKLGLSIDPASFNKTNKNQFERFAALPNLLYTNGRDWRLYRNGALTHQVLLTANPSKPGFAVTTDDHQLLDLLADFSQHRLMHEVAVARASAPFGWDARRIYADRKLEPYSAWGYLQSETFKNEMRHLLLDALNIGLSRIGERLDWTTRIVIDGLPEIIDIRQAEQDLEKGAYGIDAILQRLHPWRRSAQEPSAVETERAEGAREKRDPDPDGR